MNTLISAAHGGLSGRITARVLRGSGLKFSNYKFNAMWRRALVETVPQTYFKRVRKDKVLGPEVASQLYEYQRYNYLFQAKVTARFVEVLQPFEFFITVPSSRALTRAEIEQRIEEDLTYRMMGPGSDFGTLTRLIGVDIQNISISQNIARNL